MRVCKYCKKEIEDDLRICPKCGASVESINENRDSDTEKNIKALLFYGAFMKVTSSILAVLFFIIIVIILQSLRLTDEIYIIAVALLSICAICIANYYAVVLENKAYILKNIYEINKKTN